MSRRSSKDQLIAYFKRNLKKGYTPDSLKWALVNQGYSRVIVESALEESQKEIAKEIPVFKEKPIINYQILDQHDKPIKFRKSFWKKFLNFFRR